MHGSDRSQFGVVSGAATLAGDDRGTGQPLVFLHAGVADRRGWGDVVAQLGDMRCVTWDRRGFGDTTTEPEPFSHVDDLVAVMDDRGLDAAVLVGNSQGGRVALDAALAHPARVRALVLIAPAVTGAPPPHPVPDRVVAADALIDDADEAGDLDEVNRLEAEFWLDGCLSTAGRVTGPPRELFLEMNGRALAADDPGQERELPSAFDRLGEITVPVVVVSGDLDLPHILARSNDVVDLVPDATHAVVEAAAHLPQLERPEEVARIIAAFVDRVSD